MNLLRIIVDICLLRASPQDLPTSMNLVWVTAGVSLVVDALSLPDRNLNIPRLVFLAVEIGLFGAIIWGLLQLRGFATRWMQTITALYAANAIFSLLLLPFLPALVEMMRAGPAATPGWQVYVSLLLSVWFLVVMTRVVREATELSIGLSFLASVACIVLVRLLGFVLAPLFGMQAA